MGCRRKHLETNLMGKLMKAFTQKINNFRSTAIRCRGVGLESSYKHFLNFSNGNSQYANYKMKATHTTFTLIAMYKQISSPSLGKLYHSYQVNTNRIRRGYFLFLILFHELESAFSLKITP